LIVGRDPTREVRRLARKPGIVVTGTVPDVHPYLAGTSVVVAPFRIAQGVQNKILEALALGKAVVSTPKPAEAIGARHAEVLLIADSARDFAQCVLSLLESAASQNRFDKAAEFVRQRFDWQKNLSRLESLLEQASKRGPALAAGDPSRVEVN